MCPAVWAFEAEGIVEPSFAERCRGRGVPGERAGVGGQGLLWSWQDTLVLVPRLDLSAPWFA